jgi:hypothetical protein
MVGSIHGRSSMGIAHSVLIRYCVNKHGHHRQFLFLISRFPIEDLPWMLPTMFQSIWPSCLWQPYLLMDRYEMSILYRGPPIDASYQVSVHLAKRFQRKRLFRNHLPPIFMEIVHIWSTFRLLSLFAYEKWLLSLLKIDFFIFFVNSFNIVKSQCCYQTIKEQCSNDSSHFS